MAGDENDEAGGVKPEPKGVDIALSDTGRFDIPEDFVEEEKSVFQKPGNLTMQDAVPVIPKRAAITCFVLNLICPGLGKFQFISVWLSIQFIASQEQREQHEILLQADLNLCHPTIHSHS